MMRIWIVAFACWAGLFTLALPATAQEQAAGQYILDLHDQPLEEALKQFSAQTERGVVYEPALAAGKRTSCTLRTDAVEDLLTCVLRGTGLGFRRLPTGTYALYRQTEQARAPSAEPAVKHTVSGYVEDADTGERLIGAAVYAPALGVGTVTNVYGFYSLTLPNEPVTLTYSYLGYALHVDTLALRAGRTQTVRLRPASVLLDSVVVEAERVEPITRQTRMSLIDVPLAQIEATPALLGEVDVLKTLQLLPGVQSGVEGTSGLYVRGGGPDQNLILLDGVPVYNVNHLFGFVSVFNADAVRNVELTKGGFPARYGGRLSSVIDINLKEGNRNHHVVQGAVGLLASRLTVEGPLWKDRTSFIVSGRRTYLDLVARPFLPGDGEGRPVLWFYDFTGKVNHRFSARDHVYASFYSGSDRFGVEFEEDSGRLGWGNRTGMLRWNHLFSDKLFAHTSLTFSRYRFGVDVEENVTDEEGVTRGFRLDYDSGIRDVTWHADFDYRPGPRHYVRFGVSGTRYAFRPETLVSETTGAAPPAGLAVEASPIAATSAALYAEDDFRLSPRLQMNLGVRAVAFFVRETAYPSLEPRLSARYLLTPDLSLKASFATMQQPVHLLTNSGVGLPTDLWVPATDVLQPQEAWQGAAGLARSFSAGGVEVSLEGYYKRMQHLIAYKEGATLTNIEASYEEKIATGGEGWSYGTELFVHKKLGRTTGWLGYTLSWTNRRFEAINNGLAYPYRYDRRHDLSMLVTHRFSRRLEVSATWVYGTGNAVTLPTGRYYIGGRTPYERLGDSYQVWYEVADYGPRNGFRLPPYHRLDLSASYYFARGAKEHMLSLGFYNVYNRRNPYMVELSNGPNDTRRGVGTALFPILPALSYNFKF